MPIYEYRCVGCGEVYELLVMGSRRQPTLCPGCGCTEGERVMSVFGFMGEGIRSSAAHSSCSDCSSNDCHGCSCH